MLARRRSWRAGLAAASAVAATPFFLAVGYEVNRVSGVYPEALLELRRGALRINATLLGGMALFYAAWLLAAASWLRSRRLARVTSYRLAIPGLGLLLLSPAIVSEAFPLFVQNRRLQPSRPRSRAAVRGRGTALPGLRRERTRLRRRLQRRGQDRNVEADP